MTDKKWFENYDKAPESFYNNAEYLFRDEIRKGDDQMTDTKHTPTPWVAIKGHWEPWDGAIEISSGDYTIAYTTSGGNEEINAAHIVKCVNMHDELVATIKELLKVYNEPDESICCNGRDCGCQGASVRQQAEHYASETLKKAGAL